MSERYPRPEPEQGEGPTTQFYDKDSGRNFCVIGAGTASYSGRTWRDSKISAAEHARLLLAQPRNSSVDSFLVVKVIAVVRRTAPQVEVVDVE
jgi:hypothetical protein